MAITVKKKLTVKTLKGHAPGDAETPEEAAEGAAPVVAAPVAMTAAPLVMAGGKPASYTLAVILALLSFVFFGVLVALQYLEWDFYQGAFPVAPVPGAGPMTTTAAVEPVTPLPKPAAAPATPAPTPATAGTNAPTAEKKPVAP